jgi:hypothetical protein
MEGKSSENGENGESLMISGQPTASNGARQRLAREMLLVAE